ncbi:MAG: helix-turn-helix domain-containing protein [Anaerolineales bacterium]|nr:helix-turn-helix domain-containing protein [Anaerolineales bacterium]
MKLNLDIIRDHLPETYQVKRCGSEDRKLFVGRPLLYEVWGKLDRGRLNITSTNAMPQIPISKGNVIICVGESVPLGWAVSSNQILQISGGADTLSVLDAVHEIYNKFDAWDCALLEQLGTETEIDLKRIIQIGITILENPISVVNSTLQVIFSSKITSLADGEFRISVSDEPFPLTLDGRANLKEIGRMERALTVPFLTAIKDGERRSYCYNLYLFDHFLGCIWLRNENRLYRESDFALADHFFGYFNKAFLRYLRGCETADSTKSNALRNLLKHTPLSIEEVDLLELKPGESWICFKLKEKPDKKCMPRDYMCNTLNMIMPNNVYATLYNDEIIGLLQLHEEESNFRVTTMKLFQDFLNRMDYIGGLSDEFTDIQRIDDYIVQANHAVGRCAQKSECGTLYFFSDYILQYMLDACVSELPVESLYSKGLQALVDYDRRKKTDYVLTLDTYLKNEMRVTQTSRVLFIHRSSLLKRIDMIKRLIGDDLDDPNVRLYYRICFRLKENSFKDK